MIRSTVDGDIRCPLRPTKAQNLRCPARDICSPSRSQRPGAARATQQASAPLRADGPDFPAASTGLACFEELSLPLPIDCSETFSFRAASATLISPANTLNRIRVLVSTLNLGGHPMTHPPTLKHRSRPHNRPARKPDAGQQWDASLSNGIQLPSLFREYWC